MRIFWLIIIVAAVRPMLAAQRSTASAAYVIRSLSLVVFQLHPAGALLLVVLLFIDANCLFFLIMIYEIVSATWPPLPLMVCIFLFILFDKQD